MMELVWCTHCPADRSQWPVLDGTPEDAMRAHIAVNHPNTGDWIRGDDWDVLNEVDVLALQEMHDLITS